MAAEQTSSQPGDASGGGVRSDQGVIRTWVEEAKGVDVAVYAAVAGTPTPSLDRAFAQLARAADHSRLNIAAAGLMSLAGGRDGSRAARQGLIAVAATSAVVNALLKPVGRRRRPGRAAAGVPEARHVPMPESHSLPSGHAASAFAFATAASRVLPSASPPLLALAALVGYSRVHTGVHYPGDVIAGALVGAAMGHATYGRGITRMG